MIIIILFFFCLYALYILSFILNESIISHKKMIKLFMHPFDFLFSPPCLFLSFQDFRQLLEDQSGLIINQRDSIINWVPEGFQDFFRALVGRFMLLSGRNNSYSQGQVLTEATQADKVVAGLVLVLAQISVFIEQTAIPRITEARHHCNFFFNSYSSNLK